MEKISVVIVSWNVASSLKSCLKSIYANPISDIQVIVVDNASTDSSLMVARSFPPAKVISNTQNLGFPKAVNIALRQSWGEYLVILNPDATLPKDFFSKALTFFNRHPDAWIMGPRLTNPDGSVQGSVFSEPSVIATFKEFWLGHHGLTSKFVPSTPHSQPVLVNAISGSCLVFPRRTLERAGYFTEKVFMYFEDMDYCRRIRNLGGKVYFNPQITVSHEHGRSAKQSPQTNPEMLPFWQGHHWRSSLWYNGPLKHYLMAAISWSGQKLHSSPTF